MQGVYSQPTLRLRSTIAEKSASQNASRNFLDHFENSSVHSHRRRNTATKIHRSSQIIMISINQVQVRRFEIGRLAESNRVFFLDDIFERYFRYWHLPSKQNFGVRQRARVHRKSVPIIVAEYQRVALTLPEVGEVLRCADSWQVSRFAYGSLNKTRQSNLLVIYVPISSIIVVIRIFLGECSVRL